MEVESKINPIYKNKIDAHDIRKITKLTLRKKKINETSMQNRMKSIMNSLPISINEEQYKITIAQNYIDNNEYTKAFNSLQLDNKINLIVQMLQSTENLVRQLALILIKDFISKNNIKNTPNLIESNSFEQMINTMISLMLIQNEEKNIIYEITTILINVIFETTKYSALIIQRSNDIFTLAISIKDDIIFKQLLWIFANTMVESPDNIDNIVIKCPEFPNLIYKIIEDVNTTYLDNLGVLSVVFWIYGLFFDSIEISKFLIDNKVLIHIPIISKFCRTNLQIKTFINAVFVMRKFLNVYEDLDYSNTEKGKMYNNMIFNCNLVEYLMKYIYDEENNNSNYIDCKNDILIIFLVLAYLSDNQIDLMIKEGLLEQMENILSSFISLNKIPKNNYATNLVELLLILAEDKIDYADALVRKSSVMKLLIKGTLNKLLEKQKLTISSIVIELFEHNSRRIITELVVLYLPELLISFLDESDMKENNEIILNGLKGIKKLLMFGKKVDVEKGINIITNILEKKGCRQKLEKFSAKTNSIAQVSVLAGNILDEYFNY